MGRKIGEDYEIKDKLGEGAFAVVKLGVDLRTNESVAIKIVDRSKLSKKNEACLFREMRLTSLINHPNVVKSLAAYSASDNYYLVLEYMDGGYSF